MNEHVRPQSLTGGPETTQAAEGLPRRKWTVEELRRIIEAGIIDEDENFELLGGEVVPMSPKGRRHERVRAELLMHWGRARPDTIKFGVEAPIELSKHDWPEPDFFFHPAEIALMDATGETVLLVVEVSDSSLYKDRKLKARIYATFGMREYWVIDAKTLMTRVHTLPSAEGYGSVADIPPTERLVPRLAPAMAVRIADLDLG
jgi:Uma2 family endonuclease